ncbi:hypothetical protein MU582_16485 [Nocardioidaceae bacterium SCSIO 66511]|nr:hypothetical protein MU582_16485 [Nocardioidaceae bacterium SCSIO 66511]
MNDTARLHPEVAEFAADVRAQLSDLGADEIEELTGDLEADLQERVEEAGVDDLEDPAAYATELRSAAGLPPRADVRQRQPWHRALASGVTNRLALLEERLRATPVSSATLDFFISLRPFWWILRGWVAYEIAHLLFASGSPGAFLPHSLLGWVALLVACVVSVQCGRGEWTDRRWIPRLVIAGSVVAVLGLPFAFDHAVDHMRVQQVVPRGFQADNYPDGGLRMNGLPVRNIFAYDADGEPIDNYQLYDQAGKPLFISKRQSWDWVSIPGTQRSGQQAWNVFPLKRVKWSDSTYDPAVGNRVAKQGVVPQVWNLPMATAPELLTPPAEGGQPEEPKGDAQPPPEDAKPPN